MGNPIAPTTELHLGTVTANCGIPARLDGTNGMRSKLSVSTVAGCACDAGWLDGPADDPRHRLVLTGLSGPLYREYVGPGFQLV